MTASTITFSRFLRLLLVILAVVVCVWTIRATATFAVSRLLVKYSILARNAATSAKATELTPNDPQAYRAQGIVLGALNTLDESETAFEKAVALRPLDFSLWLALAQARESLGDNAGATTAFNEAVNRAPFYANPRWQRGNFFLRTGQYEAGFADLNQAASSKPELIPNLIDLAWTLSNGDPKLTESLAQIRTEKMRLEFARVLTRHGKPVEAMEQYRAAGVVPADVQREVLTQLLDKGAFKEAFEVWRGERETTPETMMIDGGFEEPLSLQETAFGWRLVNNVKSVGLSQDPNEPHSGGKSLRLEFAGNVPAGLAFISQLVLLEPSKRYQVAFAARSQNIVTGGRPVVVVSGASAQRKRLGMSPPLLQGTTGWQTFAFDFTTEPETGAVIINLERENCTSSPCPIFGSVLLDSFSVQPK